MNDDDDPFKSLPNLSVESFADLDHEVVTSASFSNDNDIIAEVIEGENEES